MSTGNPIVDAYQSGKSYQETVSQSPVAQGSSYAGYQGAASGGSQGSGTNPIVEAFKTGRPFSEVSSRSSIGTTGRKESVKQGASSTYSRGRRSNSTADKYRAATETVNDRHRDYYLQRAQEEETREDPVSWKNFSGKVDLWASDLDEMSADYGAMGKADNLTDVGSYAEEVKNRSARSREQAQQLTRFLEENRDEAVGLLGEAGYTELLGSLSTGYVDAEDIDNAAQELYDVRGSERYQQRVMQQQEAKGDLLRGVWDYLNAAISGDVYGAADARAELADAWNRGKGQTTDWEGREALIQEYKELQQSVSTAERRLDRGAPADAAQLARDRARLEEIRTELEVGDRRAGNGPRDYSFMDKTDNVAGGTAKRIIGGLANAAATTADFMEKHGAANDPWLQLGTLAGGKDLNTWKAELREEYESPEAQARRARMYAAADRISDSAAADLERAKNGLGALGQAGVDIAENVLEMGFDAGVGMLTGGGSLTSMFARVYGDSAREARQDGATLEQQVFYAAAAGGIEVLTEKLADGVAGIYGKGAADDITETLIRRLSESSTGQTLLRALIGAVNEGGEEVLSDLLNPLAKKIYQQDSLGDLYRQLDPAEVLYDFMIGAAIGGFGSVTGAATGQYSEANAENAGWSEIYQNLGERPSVRRELRDRGILSRLEADSARYDAGTMTPGQQASEAMQAMRGGTPDSVRAAQLAQAAGNAAAQVNAGQTAGTEQAAEDQTRYARTVPDQYAEVKIGDEAGNVKGLSYTDGKVMVRLEMNDGESRTMDVDSVRALVPQETGDLIYKAAGLGRDAPAVFAAYSDDLSIEDYTTGMDVAINMLAANGASRENLNKSSLTRNLSEAQLDIAYQIGHKRFLTEGRQAGATGKESGGVFFNGNDRSIQGLRAASDQEVRAAAQKLWGKSYQDNIRLASVVSKATGLDVVFFDSALENGKLGSTEGMYAKDGTIYVDIHAGQDSDGFGEAVIVRTLSHELTHFLEKNAPNEYKALRQFVVNHIAELGDGSFEELVTRKMQRAKDSSVRSDGDSVLSYDEAVNEVVADACEMMLTRSEMVQKLAYEQLSTARKVWEHIRKVFRKMRESVAPKSREAVLLKNQYDAMSVMWDAALEQAVKNSRSVETAEASASQVEASSETAEAGKEKSAPENETEAQYSKRESSFARDKYFDSQINQWDSKADGARIKVGELKENSALNRVGFPATGMWFDVGKIKKSFGKHGDHLTRQILKQIPDVLNDPIAITEYRGADGTVRNTVNVFGLILPDGKTPVVVGVMMTKARDGVTIINKIRTIHAHGNAAINDSNILYLNEDKKRTRKWFQVCGNSVPLEGTKFGLIRSIAYSEPESNTDFQPSLRDSAEGDTKEETADRVRSYNQLKADNAALQRQVERLRRELKPTKENTVRHADAKKAAREILADLRTDVSVDELTEVIERMGNYLVSTETEELDYAVLRRWAGEIARDIVETAEESVETGKEDVARAVKDYLYGQRLRISATDVADLGEESISAWKKNNPGVRIGTNNGLSVDIAYQELQERLGEGVLPSDVTHPADQLNLIAELLQDSTKELTRNPFAGYEAEVTESFTEDIINIAMGETVRQSAPTFADRKAQEVAKAKADGKRALTEQKARDREKLEDMRQRNRQRIAEIRRNTQARVEEARARERAKKWAKVDSLKRYYQEKERRAAARRRESGVSSELRHKIRRLHADLTRRLTRPTEKRYVPETLTKAVANLLETVNIDSGRSARMTEAFNELNLRYHQLATDTKTSGMIDPVVEDMLKKLGDRLTELKGASIYDMSSADLRMIYDTMRAVDHTTRQAVRLINYETEKDAFEIAAGMIEETREARKLNPLLKKWVFASMRPETFFKRMAGYVKDSNWEMIADMLDQAQLKQTQLQMEGGMFFEELMRDSNAFDKMTDTKSLIDIGLRDEDGKPVLITRGFAVKVYLDTLNEENSRHLMYGAYSMPDMKQYYKSKSLDAFNNGTRVRGYGVRLSELRHAYENAETEEQRQKIEAEMKAAEQEAQQWVEDLREAAYDKLGDYERKWVKAWQDFAEFSQKKLNETTMAVYGFEKATVENYVPIHTDKNFRPAQFEEITKDMSIENAGFMKERVPNASHPMLGEDITDVASRQIENVAKYAAMMPAIKNFNRVYSKGMAGFSDSVQNAVSRVFGEDATKYIQNLMTDLTSPRHTEGGLLGQFADRLRGNLAAASLTMNLRVALGQTASYPTAAAVVGWKPLLRAFGAGANAVSNEQARSEIAKWSPLMWYRMQGYFDREVGDMRKDRGLMAKLNRKLNFLTGWIEFMDGATVGRLWYAAQAYVEEHEAGLVKGSDEFMMKSAEVFNRIVEQTQPNYTTFQRPDILRNPNAIVKQLTTFMTQRLQNTNILFDAVGTYQAARHDFKSGRKHGTTEADLKAAREGLVNAVSSQLAAAATITVFKALADALMYNMKRYRDDDDELTKESFFDTLFNNFFESLASNFLAGSEIYSFIRTALTDESYYGISLSGVELFTDALSQLNKTIKDPNGKNFEKLALNAAQMLGLPMQNAAKIVNAIRLRVKDAREGNGLGSFASEIEKTDSIRARDLYKAMATGDKERINELTEYFGSQKQAQSQVAAYIKKRYKAGKMDEADAFNGLRDYAGLSADDAFWEIQDINGGKGYSRWNDIEAAVRTGDRNAFEAAADFLGEHGYDSGDVRGHVKSVVHTWFTTSEKDRPKIDKMAAEKMLVQYAGLSQWEAKDQVREWSIENVRGFSYDDIQGKFVDGDLDYTTAVDLLVRYGHDGETSGEVERMAREEARKKVDQWRCEQDNGIRYSDIQDAYIHGNITEQQAVDWQVKYGHKDREDVQQTVLEWTVARDYGIKYSSSEYGIKAAYLHGEISAETARSIMVQYGGKTEEEADAYTAQYDFTKVTGYNWSGGDGIREAMQSGQYTDDELAVWEARCNLNCHGSIQVGREYVEIAHWLNEVPGCTSFNRTNLEKWNKNSGYLRSAGFGREEFAAVCAVYNAEHSDYDSNTGESIEGSKCRKVLAYINGLQLSQSQKTTLARSLYSAKYVNSYAPW